MKEALTLTRLSEQELLDHLGELVRCDTRTTARLLAAIAEIDRRKLWAKHGYPSMFAFCMQRFHMSESMTAKRICAARKARSFPLILAMVARGELHLSGINQLGKHLTEENHEALLMQAKHKSAREIDLLLARIAPRPDVKARIRALPRRVERGRRVAPQVDAPPLVGSCGSVVTDRSRLLAFDVAGSKAAEQLVAADEVATEASAPPLHAPGGSRVSERADGAPSVSLAPTRSSVPGESEQEPASRSSFGSQASPGRRDLRRQLAPLAPRRFKVEITVGQDTHDKLRSLQDLLAHQVPNGDLAEIVTRAIALLLDDTLKKKAAITDNTPRRSGADRSKPQRSRAIPAAIRRQVWQRDSGRCAFIDERGRRCRATRCIEYHHEVPYGRGGQHELANISLRCRAHNQYQADLDFGRDFMEQKRKENCQHAARHVGGGGGWDGSLRYADADKSQTDDQREL